MKKDIEASLICSIIVEGFNKKLQLKKDPNFLEIQFLEPVIYEIEEDSSPYKYFFGEKFVEGNLKNTTIMQAKQKLKERKNFKQ